MKHLDPDQWPNLSRRLRSMDKARVYRRSYEKRPEVREARREYRNAFMREYNKRPEVKAKRATLERQRACRPDVKYRRKLREAGFTPEQIAIEIARGGFA